MSRASLLIREEKIKQKNPRLIGPVAISVDCLLRLAPHAPVPPRIVGSRGPNKFCVGDLFDTCLRLAQSTSAWGRGYVRRGRSMMMTVAGLVDLGSLRFLLLEQTGSRSAPKPPPPPNPSNLDLASQPFRTAVRPSRAPPWSLRRRTEQHGHDTGSCVVRCPARIGTKFSSGDEPDSPAASHGPALPGPGGRSARSTPRDQGAAGSVKRPHQEGAAKEDRSDGRRPGSLRTPLFPASATGSLRGRISGLRGGPTRRELTADSSARILCSCRAPANFSPALGISPDVRATGATREASSRILDRERDPLDPARH